MSKMLMYPFDGTQNCYGQDTEMYYRDDEEHSRIDSRPISSMKPLCDSCPLFDKCLEWALHHEQYGYWAGTIERDRMKLRSKLKIKWRPVQFEQFITLGE